MSINPDIVPANLDECLVLLDGLENDIKKEIKNEPVDLHFSLGMWLRNNWSLWEKNTPLVRWFNQKGIFHADDMSGIILKAYACKLQEKPYDLEEDIQHYKDYWKKLGVDLNKET